MPSAFGSKSSMRRDQYHQLTIATETNLIPFAAPSELIGIVAPDMTSDSVPSRSDFCSQINNIRS